MLCVLLATAPRRLRLRSEPRGSARGWSFAFIFEGAALAIAITPCSLAAMEYRDLLNRDRLRPPILKHQAELRAVHIEHSATGIRIREGGREPIFRGDVSSGIRDCPSSLQDQPGVTERSSGGAAAGT